MSHSTLSQPADSLASPNQWKTTDLTPVKKSARGSHHRPGTYLRGDGRDRCQITTPSSVVRFIWEQVASRRRRIGSVIDLGAGDGRFATQGRYRSYLGLEIDPDQASRPALPANARVVRKCVLESSGKFDLAIGNPPFIRNQDLAKTWTAAARSLILRSLGQDVGRLSNLYLYFLWLAMLRTKSDGVIAMVLPFEWTFRPTSRRLRSYIHQKGWEVTVYRFTQPDRYFPRIAAVPSVTIIDKATTQGGISVFDVGPRFRNLPGPPPKLNH